MDGTGKANWTAVSTLIALAALFVAFRAWKDAHDKDDREKANEPARLVTPSPKPIPPDGVVPAREYVPWGPDMPTFVSVRNDGKREALVKQVILSKGKWVRTPKRENLYGAGELIRVVFEPRHYVKQLDQYVLVLSKPAPAPGDGEWTPLEIAFVDPKSVGMTFVGRVTIVYDGLEQKHVENVQIDVLKQAPPRPDPRE